MVIFRNKIVSILALLIIVGGLSCIGAVSADNNSNPNNSIPDGSADVDDVDSSVGSVDSDAELSGSDDVSAPKIPDDVLNVLTLAYGYSDYLGDATLGMYLDKCIDNVEQYVAKDIAYKVLKGNIQDLTDKERKALYNYAIETDLITPGSYAAEYILDGMVSTKYWSVVPEDVCNKYPDYGYVPKNVISYDSIGASVYGPHDTTIYLDKSPEWNLLFNLGCKSSKLLSLI